jgi:hypothetical protein
MYFSGLGILPTLEECVEFSDKKFLSPSKIVARSNPQRKIRILHGRRDVLDDGLLVNADR